MRVTASQVLALVAAETGYSVAQLTGGQRPRPLAHARQAAYYRIYTECKHMSLPAIGRLIGGRDHTTIRHGLIRHCERIGIRYESIVRVPVYSRPAKPYVRNSHVPVTIAHYREACRYAV